MAASFEDDDFDDDAFENLPAGTLHALESRATVKLQPQPTYGPKLGVQPAYATQNHTSNSRPPLSTIQQQAGSTRHDAPGKARLDGGDEDVINLDEYSHGKQPSYSQFRLGTQTNRYSRNPSSTATKTAVNVPFRPPGRSSQPSSQQRAPQSASIAHSTDLSALQAQIQRLEKEKADLKEQAELAEARAQARTGEAAILRQRIEKTSRDYEHQLGSLRQTHQDNASRQKAELEAVQKQREKVETDKKFLEHDLALEVSRGKLRKAPAVVRSQTVPEVQVSPKKSKGLELGDGFNDDIPAVSPSKAHQNQLHSFNGLDAGHSIQSHPSSPAKSWSGGRLQTPSRRVEKKRKLLDQSPARGKAHFMDDGSHGASPIQLFSPDPSFDHIHTDNDIIPGEELEQLGFLRSLLFYRLASSQERFFDIMKTFKFSFSPLSLSAWIMDCWDQTSATKDVAMDFCNVIGNIWDTCLEQKLYDPIDSIVEIVHFTLSKRDAEFSRTLVSRIVPPATKTINVVAFPIASDRMDESGPMESVLNINTAACLELLITIAHACSGTEEASTELWKLLTLHWTLVLLFPMQPLQHLFKTCTLLQTSAINESFGPILQSSEFESVKSQAEVEAVLVDRLTSLLSIEVQPSGEPERSAFVEMLEFRQEILQTLIVICTPPRTGLPIAKHKDAIGRLMQFLLEVVNYLYTPETTIDEVHDLVTDCINTTVRILYAVLSTHADIIDIHEKLKAVDGGAHTQLLALTRIAFCESVVTERGIDPAVSDAAHALLDEFLSPVEGDQLLKMFPSIDSTALGNDANGLTAAATTSDTANVTIAAQQGSANDTMDLT